MANPVYPIATRLDNIAANANTYFVANNSRKDLIYFIPAFSKPIIFKAGAGPISQNPAYKSYIEGDYWNSEIKSGGTRGVIYGDILEAFSNYSFRSSRPLTQPEKDIIANYDIQGYELFASSTANYRYHGLTYQNLSNPSAFSIIFENNVVDSNGIISPSASVPSNINYGTYCSLFYLATGIYVRYQKKIRPTYYDLLTGFSKDNRVIPPSQITVSLSENTKIGFYKINPLESIPNLKSIDWVETTISKGAGVKIDLTGCVLGTMVSDKPMQFPPTTVNQYSYEDFLYQNLDALFTKWKTLANNETSLNELRLLSANNNIWSNNPITYTDINYDVNHPLFKVDNQRAYDWHIKPQSDGSRGTLIMDSPRTIEIHAALEAAKYKAEVPAVIGTGTADNPQTPAIHTLGYSIANGGGQKLTEIHAALEAAKYKAEVPAVIGTGTTDNPQTPAIHTLGYSIANGGGQKLNEIHTALEAAKYKAEVPAIIGTGTADNPQTPAIHTLGYSIANGGGQKLTEIHKALDAEKYSKVEGSNIPRVATLGHLISKISAILGYRPEPDGSFTEDTEKKLVRKIVPSTEKIDKKKIGVNNFGSDGMLLKRLNNRFNGDKIANDECVIVKDLPQLLAEYQDQINLALGLQESSAVEIKNNSETSRYSNQLAMLSELLNLASSNHDMIRAALISSLIAQGQTSETIAALGLPTVTKTLPIDVDGKITHLPYKGVAPHRSISQEVATCTQNVGIVLGQLL
jgi:hypothetical protein